MPNIIPALPVWGRTTSTGFDKMASVFISFRIREAAHEARLLQTALESHGLRVFTCEQVQQGTESLAGRIGRELDRAQLIIVLGTRTYGTKTASPCSTREELDYVLNNREKLFFIKMCDFFEDSHARAFLTESLSYIKWTPGSPIPATITQELLARFFSASLTAARSVPGSSGGQSVHHAASLQNKRDNQACARVLYDNGDCYEGAVQDGKRHGTGLYFYRSSATTKPFQHPNDPRQLVPVVYDGSWEHDKRCGRGRLYLRNPGRELLYVDAEWVNDEAYPLTISRIEKWLGSPVQFLIGFMGTLTSVVLLANERPLASLLCFCGSLLTAGMIETILTPSWMHRNLT